MTPINSCSLSGRGARHVTVSSSLLSGQPLLAPPVPACWTTTTTGKSYPASSMHSVEWVNSEEKPHSQPPPKTGSGRLVWKSKLTRYPRPNPDLPAPQLPNPQHQTRMMLQDADAPDVAEVQPRPFGPERARGLTRLPWRPEGKAPVRLRLPEPRLPPHHHPHHHHYHHHLSPLDSLRL